MEGSHLLATEGKALTTTGLRTEAGNELRGNLESLQGDIIFVIIHGANVQSKRAR